MGLAGGQDNFARRQRTGSFQLVGGQHDRLALSRCTREDRVEHRATFGVEASVRLVEEEQAGTPGERNRQGQTSALTGGELAVDNITQRPEPEMVDDLLVRGCVDPRGSGSEAQVLCHGEVVVTGCLVSDETELATMTLAVFAQIVAEDLGRPGVQRNQPGKQSKQGGLARSVPSR